MEYCIKIYTALDDILYLKEYDGKASKFTLYKAEAFAIDDLGAMEIIGDEICNMFDSIGGDPIMSVHVVEKIAATASIGGNVP